MDYVAIVEKALKKEDYSADVKDFNPEQKAELSVKIKEAADGKAKEALDAIDARRQELKRLNDKPIDPPKEDPTVMAKFQKEQEDEARSEFLSDPNFLIPDDKKATFEDIYKVLKKGEVSKSQIKQVLKKTYAATMGDDLIDARNRISEMERGAKEFNNNGARATVKVSPADQSKYSKAAQELFGQWQAAGYSGKNYTLDRAEKIANSEGMERRM